MLNTDLDGKPEIVESRTLDGIPPHRLPVRTLRVPTTVIRPSQARFGVPGAEYEGTPTATRRGSLPDLASAVRPRQGQHEAAHDGWAIVGLVGRARRSSRRRSSRCRRDDRSVGQLCRSLVQALSSVYSQESLTCALKDGTRGRVVVGTPARPTRGAPPRADRPSVIIHYG
jgi:hypothetical protein